MRWLSQGQVTNQKYTRSRILASWLLVHQPYALNAFFYIRGLWGWLWMFGKGCLGGKSEEDTLKRGECGNPCDPSLLFCIFQRLCKFEGRASSHKTIECSVLWRTHSPQVFLYLCLAVSSLHRKGLGQGWDVVWKSTTYRLDIGKGGSLWGRFTHNSATPWFLYLWWWQFHSVKILFSLGKYEYRFHLVGLGFSG